MLGKITKPEQLASITFSICIIVLLNWVFTEHYRFHYYENLRSQLLLGNINAILLTIVLALIALYVALVGWFGVNSATDLGIPRLEIATAAFIKTLAVVASISTVLGTIGSSGGEIASAFFEGLRIIPNLLSGNEVDSAGIFSVYVANFSGVVNALAAVFAGIVLLIFLTTGRITKQQFINKTRELESKAVLALALGLLILYSVQSAVTWDGKPTFWQSSLVVIVGVIVFIIGYQLHKKGDKDQKPKLGRDFIVNANTNFSLKPKKLGEFLALNTIGNSHNIFVVTPRFMLALATLISLLIIPIEFGLSMLGFGEIILAFAVAFITSIVEILLVISAGEMAIFLLLGSNVIDVVFGLFFGEVIPQTIGEIAYHHSMPAISLYSALFAFMTFLGIVIARFLYKNNKEISAAIMFVFFVLLGGIVYNGAVFFNGIPPMNSFITSKLAHFELPIFYIGWAGVLIYGAAVARSRHLQKQKISEEVLTSLTKLKNYYDGATFVIQVDGDSLRKHLNRVSYIIKYLFDAEKYLGGDGALAIMVENKLITSALTENNYQKILTELAHTAPPASPTILTDTIKYLLDKNNVADISMARPYDPVLFISLQSDLLLEDLHNGLVLAKSKVQQNPLILEVGCFDTNESIEEKLSELAKTQWVGKTSVSGELAPNTLLASLFDKYSEFVIKRRS